MTSFAALLTRSFVALSLVLSPLASAEIASTDAPGPMDDGAVEAIETELPASRIIENALALTIQFGKKSYDVGFADNATDSQYKDLPEHEKRAFRRNRALFLEATAKGLQFLKYGIGIGSVMKENAVYLARKVRRQPADPAAANASMTLKERSEDIVLGILRGIDKKLFESAPIIARANEFGIVVAGGVEALGGVGTKGFGGLIDLGISIGYNRDTRSLVFQIFRDVESYHASPGAAVGGFLAKAGFYAANQHDQVEDKGISFYPPMMPGFQSTTESSVMFGFSSGLTLPPSPFGDVLTYTNRLDHARLLRLTISPMVLGFVRIQTSLPGSAVRDVRMFLGAVAKAAYAVQAAAGRILRRSTAAPLCRVLFSVSGA